MVYESTTHGKSDILNILLVCTPPHFRIASHNLCLLTRMFQEPTKCVPYPRRMKPTSMILLNMKFDCDNMKDRMSEEDTQQQHY